MFWIFNLSSASVKLTENFLLAAVDVLIGLFPAGKLLLQHSWTSVHSSPVGPGGTRPCDDASVLLFCFTQTAERRSVGPKPSATTRLRDFTKTKLEDMWEGAGPGASRVWVQGTRNQEHNQRCLLKHTE